jgi:RNA polymerase sigma-70 factor (ECF subfamily)
MADASAHFPATRWTLVQTLREGSEADVKVALEALCKAYWAPLYIVARQTGLSVHDAEDSVQGFFESILERDALLRADQNLGKLRSFLLIAYERYRIKTGRSKVAAKRGSGIEPLSASASEAAEARYLQVSAEGTDVETLYNREWARSLLERSMSALRRDYEKQGQGERFSLFAVHLTEAGGEDSLSDSAVKAGMSYSAFRQGVFRLRRSYRERIEDELAVTLGTRDPETIRQEMLDLFRAF